METRDVIVVGGGVSGLSFAYHSASKGRRTLVLESSERIGGCLDTRRLDSGFWFEMGAHTCYNSYRNLLEIIEGCGLAGRIQPRGEVRKRFGLIRDGKLEVMGPLSVFRQFDLWEMLRSLPAGLAASKSGQSVRAYYSRLIGRSNYEKILCPFLSAVPSQNVDDFPAEGPGSLFKRRPRRKEIVKSFTMESGLSTIVDGISGQTGIEVLTHAGVCEVRNLESGFEVRVCDGRALRTDSLALAVPPSAASGLIRKTLPGLAELLAGIKMAAIETVGAVVRREQPSLPDMAFVVPERDIFFSAVTRDVVCDAMRRGFAFHFEAGHSLEEKMARIEEIIGVRAEQTETLAEKSTCLPSPVLGHAALVREIDRFLAGRRLAVTGNYFSGLAIEDCVSRSKSEWARIAALG